MFIKLIATCDYKFIGMLFGLCLPPSSHQSILSKAGNMLDLFTSVYCSSSNSAWHTVTVQLTFVEWLNEFDTTVLTLIQRLPWARCFICINS